MHVKSQLVYHQAPDSGCCALCMQVKACAPAAAVLYVAETLAQGLQEQVSKLKEEVQQLRAAIAQRDAKDRQAMAVASNAAKRVRTVMVTRPGCHMMPCRPALSLLPAAKVRALYLQLITLQYTFNAVLANLYRLTISNN